MPALSWEATALSGHIMWPEDLLLAMYGRDREEILWNQGNAWDCIRVYTQQRRLTFC